MDRIPLYLLALIVAIANSPTNIFQVCAWNVGTVETEPWRRRSSLFMRGTAAISRLRAWIRSYGLMAAVTVGLILMIMLAPHGGQAVLLAVAPLAAPANLRPLQQRATVLHGDIAKKSKERAAIGETIVAENRAMTEDERAKFVALGKDLDGLKAQLEENDLLLAAAKEAQAADLAFRGSTADADATAAERAATSARIVPGRVLSDDDPKRGFRDHKELLADVMEAGRTGRISAKLKPLQAVQGSDEAGVYSDPAGGFLVPHGVAPGLLMTDAEADFIAPMVTSISPMTAPTVSFNARVDKDHTTSVSGGFTVTRRPETVDGTPSRTSFEQVTLTANEEFGLAFATERILNDSPQSFVAIIAAGFGDEFANNAIKERLRGSGVGERLGIIHALNTSLVTVSKETGQAADTIVKENIDKMAARCWRYNQAVWIANNDTRPQLRSLVQVIGTGGVAVPYFESSGGVEKLDGRPLYFTEHASKIGDVGDLILCVWSQYLEGEYQQMQTAESIHVRFVSAERAFRFYKRNDGRPWWRAPLTPAQSTATLSPWVVLAAR